VSRTVSNVQNPKDSVTVEERGRAGVQYVRLDIGEGKGSRHTWLSESEAKKVARFLLIEAGKL
jgi:hypothetical protein